MGLWESDIGFVFLQRSDKGKLWEVEVDSIRLKQQLPVRFGCYRKSKLLAKYSKIPDGFIGLGYH